LNVQAPLPNSHDLPPEIADALARASDRLGRFAQRVLWYPELTSTNDVAASLADRGAPEGTIVAADAQTAGRGRQGRVWVSPPGAGLYVSVVLRPRRDAAALLTLAAGVALSEGIEAATGLPTDVKWPNDVYVALRKLAGILAEAGSSGTGLHHVILGCGINILPAAFPPDIARRATSLESELGRPVDRGLVLAECLAGLASRYADLEARRLSAIVEAWRGRAALTFGRAVEWDVSGTVRRGVAENIDDAGALLVRTDGGVTRVVAGEVRWI
jgi:BirA family biotin operon repressor/biotin-[acetyl-CoA-carboxylase] ligase